MTRGSDTGRPNRVEPLANPTPALCPAARRVLIGRGIGMRRVALAIGLALVIVSVAVAPISATHSLGSGPKMDLVAGTGTLVVPEPFVQAPQLHVNAKRDPETGQPQGRFFIRVSAEETREWHPEATGAFSMRGAVVCLNVAVNTATLVGRIDQISGVSPYPAASVGAFVRMDVTDLGEPGTLDRANFHFAGVDPNVCPANPGDLAISQGNFIVHDSPPDSLLAVLDVLIREFEAAAGFPFDD